MKTAIIYYSKHHENTKKLLDAIKDASADEITLFDVTTTPSVNLNEYDLIGFASGIYYSKFEKRVLEFAENNTPNGKNVFLIYTCGAEKKGYTEAISEALSKTNANILGEYGCLGFDTFGPFKLIGGIAKNHPNDTDTQNAISFYNGLHK
ncbi:MAG: flavodoxin family protein [Acutalibacteraceae bacterium]